MNLFETKVKYQKVLESGKEKIVTENYLLDAVSFSDAETRTYKELEPYISGEVNIMAIKRSNISEIIESEGEIIYKATFEMVSIDEEKGVEKKSRFRVLVWGDDVKQASKKVEEYLSAGLSDFKIIGVTDSNIADYFPITD